MRIARFCGSPHPPAFLRELFENIELSALSQAESDVTNSIPSKASRSAKYQRTTGKMPAPLRRTEDQLPGHAMACSLQGIPYRDRGLYRTSPNPANRPPISLIGAAPKGAPGSSTAHLSSFQRVAQPLIDCKQRITAVATFREYQRIGIRATAAELWKAANSVGIPRVHLDGRVLIS